MLNISIFLLANKQSGCIVLYFSAGSGIMNGRDISRGD